MWLLNVQFQRFWSKNVKLIINRTSICLYEWWVLRTFTLSCKAWVNISKARIFWCELKMLIGSLPPKVFGLAYEFWKRHGQSGYDTLLYPKKSVLVWKVFLKCIKCWWKCSQDWYSYDFQMKLLWEWGAWESKSCSSKRGDCQIDLGKIL